MTMKLDAFEKQKITEHLRAMGVDKADAAGIWTVNQLTQTLKRSYEQEYPKNSVLNLFPVTTELAPHVKYFEYPTFDGVGLAQIVADYSDDLPLVDALTSAETGKVFRLGNAFLISIDEIKVGQATGQSLSSRKQSLAFEAHDNKVDDLVWKGSAPHGILSVFNTPNASQVVPQPWDSAETAVADITSLIDIIETATDGFHRATHLLLPASARRMMQTLVPNTSISYQQLFATNNTGLTIEYLAFLDNYDGSNGKAAIAYEKDPMNMSIEIPEATNALPAQPRDLHFRVPVTSKATGLIVYRPLTLAIMKGITFA